MLLRLAPPPPFWDFSSHGRESLKHSCHKTLTRRHAYVISDPRRGCYIVLSMFIFFSFFFFFSFFSPLLSGSYLWNRYLQRLQIECAAWSCCLILHYSLPPNSLRYFFFLIFFFFSAKILSGPYLWNRYSQTPNWVCCLVLWSNFALLLTIQFASLFLFFFFRHDFVRAISLEPLLAETSNWVCCLVLRSNFALLLTIQFALLISSLINIISLLLTTFDWTKVRGSLLGRIQGDREPVSFLLLCYF